MKPQWGALSLFGHTRHVGLISEQRRFGVDGSLVRVPHHPPKRFLIFEHWAAERWYSAKAIYGFEPIPEADAREQFKQCAEANTHTEKRRAKWEYERRRKTDPDAEPPSSLPF